MIACLSLGARWLLHASLSKSEGDDGLIRLLQPHILELKAFTWQIDLNIASFLVPVDLSWYNVRALCEKSILGLKGVLEQDIDHVSKLLSELDPLAEQTEVHSQIEPLHPTFIPQALRSSGPVSPVRRTRKRRRPSTLVSTASGSKPDIPMFLFPAARTHHHPSYCRYRSHHHHHPLSITISRDFLLGTLSRRFLRYTSGGANLHHTQ